MSHYTTYQTVAFDENHVECLAEAIKLALQENFPKAAANLRVLSEAEQVLRLGYTAQGISKVDKNKPPVRIVIPREHIGSLVTDFGVSFGPNGAEFHMDETMLAQMNGGEKFAQKIRLEYSMRVVEKAAAMQNKTTKRVICQKTQKQQIVITGYK